MRVQLIPLAFTALCAWPRLASACPSCFSGATDNREAFFGTFLFLTTVPLVGMGLLVWWLLRRARALDAEQRGDEEGTLPPAPGIASASQHP